MEVTKKSSIVKTLDDFDKVNKYVNLLDSDVKSLVTLTQGKIRFGDGSDGFKGENISGEFRVKSDTGNADTEFSITHTLGASPIGYIVTKINKAGVIYDSGTTWTSDTIYLKCNVANCNVSLFLIK